MQNKRKIRELAMQVLFLWDSQDKPDRELAQQLVADGSSDEEARAGALHFAQSAWDMRGTTDPWIERLAPQWPVRRQPGVDRNLLRLAVWELISTPTPPKVVIDEAIELAKEFSTEHSPAFINGVLDAVLREHSALTGRSSTTDERR